MVEYNLGEGIEPEDTQGSQGAQPQHSLVSLCSWLKVPSFPSPGQGRAGHCALMLPLVRIRSFHSHQLVLLSCQEQRGLQCSDAFNSLRFGSFFQNLLSKTALHIPALISRLFLLKKNPKCLRTGAQCPPLCGEGRVPSGREEGKAQIVCEPDPATFAMTKFRFNWASLCPGAPLSVHGCPWVLLLFVPGLLSPSDCFDFAPA